MGCMDSGGSESTSYTPKQKKYLHKALDVYGGQLGQGENIYQGLRVAPMSEQQKGLMGTSTGYLNAFAPGGDMPLYGDLQTTLSNTLAGRTGAQPITQQQTSDYFSRVYEKPTAKTWAEDIKPGIEEQYAGPGYWGSARAGAVTKGAQDMADWLGEQRGQVSWDVLQANRQAQESIAQRQLSATEPAMRAAQLPTQEARQRLAGAQGVYGMLGQEQAQRQAEINASVQKFAEENRITSQEDMQILLTLLGMNYSSAESRGPGLGYQTISQLAGGAGQALGNKYLI